jgi:hypothetical protein
MFLFNQNKAKKSLIFQAFFTKTSKVFVLIYFSLTDLGGLLLWRSTIRNSLFLIWYDLSSGIRPWPPRDKFRCC